VALARDTPPNADLRKASGRYCERLRRGPEPTVWPKAPFAMRTVAPSSATRAGLQVAGRRPKAQRPTCCRATKARTNAKFMGSANGCDAGRGQRPGQRVRVVCPSATRAEPGCGAAAAYSPAPDLRLRVERAAKRNAFARGRTTNGGRTTESLDASASVWP